MILLAGNANVVEYAFLSMLVTPAEVIEVLANFFTSIGGHTFC